jgi:hypothetical protein
MKKNFLNLVLAFASLFLVVGCDRCKNESCEDSYIPISSEFKSYCVFPAGSYWIYENASDGIRDTVTLLSYESEIGTSFNNNNECTETAILRLSSTYQGVINLSVTTNLISGSSWSNELRVIYSNSSFERFILPDNDIMLEYDTITLNSILYQDVYVFESLSAGFGDPILEEVFAKNIGVIYRKFDNNAEFHLIEYNLN